MVGDAVAPSTERSDRRAGRLVEAGPTAKIFTNPDDERTEQYVSGKFG